VKTIAPAAMAAIVAGDALVGGAVEITPLNVVNYTTVGVTDLAAGTHSAKTAVSGLSVGITLSGFSPTDIVRVSLPAGQIYTAWNSFPPTGQWRSFFSVVPDGDAASEFTVGAFTIYSSAAAAFAGFGIHTFTGASSYTFFFLDDVDATPTDNTGGLSILVERGVPVGAGTPLRLWSGYGSLEIGGNAFDGIGGAGLAQQNGSAIGGVAQGMTLSLSGIEPDVLALLDDADQFKGASVVVYRLIFDNSGKNLLDAHVFDRGRLDTIQTDETIGSTATISCAVESAARSLGRSGARMRSDSDQRLISSSDGYFKGVAYAGQKELYWGGKIPVSTGDTHGGVVAGTAGGTGAGF